MTSITLVPAITRGTGDKAKTHSEISLRKPKSGELRGLAISDLIRMDVGALITLIPRISSPALTKEEVEALDPSCLADIGIEVTGFFGS